MRVSLTLSSGQRAIAVSDSSGDGHLSVIDIRVNKAEPHTLSDDQEDELLSIVPIKGGQRSVVGSTLGTLTIWDRSKGWRDCACLCPLSVYFLSTWTGKEWGK